MERKESSNQLGCQEARNTGKSGIKNHIESLHPTYYYNSTLTAYSYKDKKEFNLTNSDPNIIFAGIEDGSEVSLQSVQWQAATYPDGYEGDIRGERDGSLTPLAGSDKKYEFTLQVGNLTDEGKAWSALMPRSTTTAEQIIAQTWTAYNSDNTSPRFNVHLLDNVNNCPVGSEETYFNNHLGVPERVKLIIKSRKKDGTTSGGEQAYEYKTYNVNLEIVYLQGPSFTGNVDLLNCALPGERIGFSSKNIQINTTQQLPVTSYGWTLVPLKENLAEGTYDWDETKGIDIPKAYYGTNAEGHLEGSIPALYSQDKWNIFYSFYAGGEKFTVKPTTDAQKELSDRMLVVHNYHKMADITDVNYDAVLGSAEGNSGATPGSAEGNLFGKVLKAGARIYIADNADLTAFMNYVNAGNTGEGLNFYLQDNLTLPADWSISKEFAGTLHGDGYVLDASAVTSTKTLFGNHLTGETYNLGVANGTIATVPEGSHSGIINCFDNNTPEADKRYGKSAYNLSHYHNATSNPDYVAAYYAGEDWRYARIYEKITSDKYLRTKAPNYRNTQTSHNTEHAAEYTPVEHDYLFFGQTLTPTGDAHPVHIADNEANRVYEAEGYYNSKINDGFYYNKATAWAMQPGLTAVRFDNAAGNVPTAMGAVEVVTRNLLVFEADAATQAAGSKAYFHVKGKKGGQEYYNTQNVYACANLALVDKQDFNAPYAFTAKQASYVRTPAYFVETLGTAWESICLPFSPSKTTLSEGIERHEDGHGNAMIYAWNNDESIYKLRPVVNGEKQTDITFFWGKPTDAMLVSPKTNDRTLNHEYWLRMFSAVGEKEVEGQLKTVANFVRPDTFAFEAYKPYIVSFPGERFYEFNMSKQTITFSKDNAVITVTDDATKFVKKNSYTYTGAFKNEAEDGKFVINNDGSAFTSGAIVPFRGWLSATTSAKRSRTIFIGSDYDDVIVQEEQEKPFAPDGSKSNVFLIRTNGLQVTIISSQSLECPCHTVSGASLGVWMIPVGESRFTVPSPGIYILNGRKFVVK